MITRFQNRIDPAINGFTLIELIIAISVSVIVVGFMVMFITVPVDNYIAQSRRAQLSTEADIIQRIMDNDIRNAVPNTVRWGINGSNVILEMLNTVDVAIYRDFGSTSPQSAIDELTFAPVAPDANFSTLGKFKSGAAVSCLATFRLVISPDQSSATTDVYAGGQVVTAPANTLNCNPDPTFNKTNVTITPGFQFKTPSPGKHVFVISAATSAIAYVCNLNTRTLTRFSGYPIALGLAANRNAAATNHVVSTNIEDCQFPNTPGTSLRPDLVSVYIKLKQILPPPAPPTTDFYTLFFQSSLDYSP